MNDIDRLIGIWMILTDWLVYEWYWQIDWYMKDIDRLIGIWKIDCLMYA